MIATFAEIDRKYQLQAEVEKADLALATLARLNGRKLNSSDTQANRRQIIADNMDRVRNKIMALQEDLMLLQFLADSYSLDNRDRP